MTGTSNNGTITYTYDNRGNRLTQTRDGITVSYTYDLNNRLTTSTANGVTGYTYDASGNTLSVMGTSGSATYTYDLFNRQKTHTSGGVVTTTTYRPDGLRHSIGNTKHIWDGQNIVGEYVGTAYKKYFRALTLIYRLASNTKQWYNTNGHGDVIALTNATGTVVKTYTYNAFGEEQDISTTDGNPFRYCGEYYDTACGTLYLRARNYNASIGRFTQEDPIRDGGNWYSYCGSNPVNAHDPSGLSFWYYDEEGNKVEDYTRRPVIAKIEPISVKDNNYKKIEITGKRTMEPQKGTGISYYFNAMRGTKSFFGYNIAIDTYKHSLFGNGKDLNYYNNSMMAYELRASSKY